ncbi:hypothetical protein [Actinomadura fibrosa]|uniref:DUF892 family protein n=1 Tax=Actinomadura fibrosa TaxID=111802 RepID=A0ABW2XU57_9ACTN|nr:hypothetical protein [Actinomadura fibrosa]
MDKSDARRYLEIYLTDHAAAAAGGVERARSTARALAGSPEGDRLQGLADDIAADRGALLSIMKSLGIPVRQYKVLAVRAGELAGRLKFNGRLRERSPLTDLVEFEALRLGVEGKAACWRALAALTDQEPALDADELALLQDRAQAQIDLLERLRKAAVDEVFRGRAGRPSSTPASAERPG